MRAYYQTTPLTRDELNAAFAAAAEQDELVLACYRHADSIGSPLLSPSQVHAVGVKRGNKWPPTSVRRSISNLTAAGVLVKTELCRMGPLGRPEHLWRLASGVQA